MSDNLVRSENEDSSTYVIIQICFVIKWKCHEPYIDSNWKIKEDKKFRYVLQIPFGHICVFAPICIPYSSSMYFLDIYILFR